MGNIYNKLKSQQDKNKKIKTTKRSVATKQRVEKKYTDKLSKGAKKHYTGNRVSDAMKQQTYYNSQPENPEYAYLSKLRANKDRMLTGGRAHWKIGQDVKDAKGKKTGEYKKYSSSKIKDNYRVKYIEDKDSTANMYGKKVKGYKQLSTSDAKEFSRNMNKSAIYDKYDLSPIHKVEPTGKQTSPIKEGFKQASKSKTLLGKAGAIGGGLAGGALNGVMEVVDGLNALNYGAHGYSSGFVEGFNNDGKLNHGEILNAFTNAGKKGSKGLRAGLTKDNEGRYGWYDTLKAFSDDKKEDRIREGEIFTDADEKKRLSKLMWGGLGLDIGGALLTANAGSLAKAGAKTGNKALTGLSKVAKVTDLGIDLPIADLIRGSGKTLKGTKAIATNFDEVAPKLTSKLGDMGKVANTPENFKHMADTVVRDVNKARGVRTPSHGIKLGGFEITSPKTVQHMADSDLNIPGRALNSVIDKIKATRKATGRTPEFMDNMINVNVGKAVNSNKLRFAPGNLADGEVATDMQLLARKNNGTSEGIQRSNWANQKVLEKKMGISAPHTAVDEENLLNALDDLYEVDVKKDKSGNIYESNVGKYRSVRREESMDNAHDLQFTKDNNIGLTEEEARVLDWRKQQEGRMYNASNIDANNLISPHIAPIVQDKPALQNVISRLRNSNKPMRMTEQGSDGFYDYLEKNNPGMYKKFTGESDLADEIIDRDIYRAEKRADSKYVKDELGVDKRQLLQQQKYDELFGNRAQLDELNKTHAKNVKPTLIEKNIKPTITHNEKRTTFENTLKEMFKPNLDKKSILQKQADIENATKLLAEKTLARKDRISVINKLNDIVFDGQKVLSHNAEKNDLKQLVRLLNDGLDNSHNEVPEILNKPMSEIKKYMESVTDDNYKAKFNKRIDEFGTTKTKLNKEIDKIKSKGKLTITDREEIRKLEKTKDQFDKWWDVHGKMSPDEWEKAYPTLDPKLKGYNEAISEHADIARYNKPTSNYEIPDDVDINGEERLKVIRKQFNLPETKSNKAKIKLSNGQRMGDLPPVKQNLAHLRSAIEQEMQLRHNNPTMHREVQSMFKQIKKGYVDTLRSLGVRDEQYFHKVQALVKELEDAQSKPLMKMDLQKLARKISDTFDEIEGSVLDYTDEITPLSDVTPLDKLVRGDKPIKDKLQALIGKTPENGSSNSIAHIDDALNREQELMKGLGDYWNRLNTSYVGVPELKQWDNMLKEYDSVMNDKIEKLIPQLKHMNTEDLANRAQVVENAINANPNPSQLEGNAYYLPRMFEAILDELNGRYAKQLDMPIPKTQKLNTPKQEITPLSEITPLDKLVRQEEPVKDKLQALIGKTPENGSESVTDGYINDFERFMQKTNQIEYKNTKPKEKIQMYSPDEIGVPRSGRTDIDEIYKKVKSTINQEDSVLDEIATTSEEKPLLSMNPSKNTPSNTSKKTSNPLDKLLRAYDIATREFKAGVTKNNPGWHVMNAVQNKMNSSYGIGADVFNRTDNKQGKMVVDAMMGQRNWLGKNFGKAPKTDAELSQIMINDKYSLKDIKDIAQQEGLIDDTFMNDLGNPKSKIMNILAPSGDKSMWSGFGADKLFRTEENDKMHHLISKLKQTGNSAEAVESVNRTLFDYDDITDVEKNVAKRIAPFYTYYRKNIPLQFEQFANSPRSMATYMDAKNQFEKGIEDEDKQRRNEWTANRLQVPNTTMEEEGRDDTMYNKMFNPSTPWDALMQAPTPNSEGINNMPSANPILESLVRYYGTKKDMFGNNYKDNNKNILDVLGEQYGKPTMGVAGKTMDIGKQNSKQNDELMLLQLLTGLKTKYYKSNDEWNIEEDEPFKPSNLKKILVRKYK